MSRYEKNRYSVITYNKIHVKYINLLNTLQNSYNLLFTFGVNNGE